MNREIKFRVRNTKTNEWVHGPGYEVNLFGETILLGGFMDGVGLKELDDCVPLQFTGLKDKNGKEVYEGDIVLGKVDGNCLNHDKDVFVVEYDETYSAFVLTKRGGKSWNWIRNVSTDGEVIGNIFENLDLSK